MKIALNVGWICLALEAVAMTMMLTAEKGGDAAGAGMAKGFGILLAILVGVAGALLLWGQLGRSPMGAWGGAVLAGVPCAAVLLILLSNLVPNFSRMAFQSRVGKYADARMTKIAQAMIAGDYAKQRELVKAGGIDWAARDRNGVTLLGRAVKLNQDMITAPKAMEGLQILLEAGAPLAPDALRPEEFAGTDSLLMVAAAGTNARLLEALLKAGGDPNFRDSDGTPLVFLSYIDLERLKLLVQYGVDVNSVDPDPMRRKRSLVMHFAERRETAAVEFLLSKGANAEYRAEDGATLAGMMAGAGR